MSCSLNVPRTSAPFVFLRRFAAGALALLTLLACTDCSSIPLLGDIVKSCGQQSVNIKRRSP